MHSEAADMRDFSVLISSSGRRVGLMECFKQALHDLDLKGGVYAIDCSRSSPAFQLAEKAWTVPKCTDPAFPDAILSICKGAGIRLIVPTIDTELPIYAKLRNRFGTQGIHVCVSSPETVEVCRDKQLTHSFFLRNGFPTVRLSTPQKVAGNVQDWQFPLIVKPFDGSSSVGVRKVNSVEELSLMASDKSLLVQDLAPGTEHTINIYMDASGKCLCAVPHLRLEVRGGEVSKGVTVKNTKLMALARQIGEALPGAQGPLNVQCFVEADGTMKCVEVNARFGGGYPLAHMAGAHFTHWLIEDVLKLNSERQFDGWQDDLAMLRYDNAVFIAGREIRLVEKACVA
jgi:carbamoyl-phosphate synthase large subunit